MDSDGPPSSLQELLLPPAHPAEDERSDRSLQSSGPAHRRNRASRANMEAAVSDLRLCLQGFVLIFAASAAP